MALETIRRHLFQHLAELLEYPQPGLVGVVRECEALISQVSSLPISGKNHDNRSAAVLLREFRTFVEATPLGRLEEIYSGTFDLDAACHPYVGYHLFGESYKRSVFLLELKERYRARGFDVPENELPDHLAVLLRFLAITDDVTLAGEIIHEALLPALERMMGKAKSAGYDEGETPEPPHNRRQYNPYRGILEALELVLQGFPTNDEGQSLSL
jgi:nitrate reductase delta subunit